MSHKKPRGQTAATSHVHQTNMLNQCEQVGWGMCSPRFSGHAWIERSSTELCTRAQFFASGTGLPLPEVELLSSRHSLPDESARRGSRPSERTARGARAAMDSRSASISAGRHRATANRTEPSLTWHDATGLAATGAGGGRCRCVRRRRLRGACSGRRRGGEAETGRDRWEVGGGDRNQRDGSSRTR